MRDVVVIGAGQAAATAIARLRSKGFDGGITLIGDEPVPPYQRPPLSKSYLLGDMEKERLFLRPPSFYHDNAVTLRLGQSADRIDPHRRQVHLHDHVIPYDELILCTGSTPRCLPAAVGGNLSNVFTVRGLADVDAMSSAFVPGARVLIVGGGYIGLEAAAVAAKLGLTVTLVEMADRILQRVAARETSAWFADLHRRNGVDLREGTGLVRLTGETCLTGADLSDGSSLALDFCIVGIGITPNTALASAAGLRIDNGIATDAQGRTSDPHIWAAGDCASFPQGEQQVRLESVGNAIDMAEVVADNILGAGRSYIPKPWFWSDQYDVKLQIAGLGAGHDHVVVRTSGESALSHWYYAGDRLLAIDAINDSRAYMVAKRLIEAGHSADPQAVADPQTDLKALLRP